MLIINFNYDLGYGINVSYDVGLINASNTN